MSGLEDLYREIILDHYKNPRNKRVLETPPAHKAQGMNPLCGDEIDVYVAVDGTGPSAAVVDVSFGGQGCSISQSSASMMSGAVKGKTVEEARTIIATFLSMMGIHSHEQGDEHGPESAGDEDPLEPTDAAPVEAAPIKLGDLEALRGVVKFPVRIKCATLAWFTLTQAFDELAAR